MLPASRRHFIFPIENSGLRGLIGGGEANLVDRRRRHAFVLGCWEGTLLIPSTLVAVSPGRAAQGTEGGREGGRHRLTLLHRSLLRTPPTPIWLGAKRNGPGDEEEDDLDGELTIALNNLRIQLLKS